MLIYLITPISRKVLDCNQHIFFLCGFHVITSIRQHSVRIISIGTHIGDRISPVSVYIHNRRKCPITSNRSTFTAAYFSKSVSILYVPGCSHLHLLTILCPINSNPAAAILKIRTNQKRDLTIFLKIPMCLLHLLCLSAPIHDSSDVMCKHDLIEIFCFP